MLQSTFLSILGHLFFTIKNGLEGKWLEDIAKTFVEFTHKLDPERNSFGIVFD